MAYHDDLYNYDNIIGYTGELHNLPTVYFVSEKLRLAGHITQQHDIDENIGREAVINMQRGYTFGNEPNNAGREVLFERRYGKKLHESRNPLIYVNYTANGSRPASIHNYAKLLHTMSILAQAIYTYQSQKPVSTSKTIKARVMKTLFHAQKNDMTYSQMKSMGNLDDYKRVNFTGRQRSF